MAASLQGKARCSICLGWYKDPLITRCGHRFCHPCFTACIQGSQGDPLCPQCKLPCPLAELGLQCQGDGVCQEHLERLKLFCEEDETLICETCRGSGEHEQHKVRPLQEAAAEYKGKLQDWLPPLMEETDRIMKSKLVEEDVAKDMRKHLEFEKMETVSEFRRLHKRLHKLLEDQEQTILESMEEMHRKLSMTEKENVDKLSNQICCLNKLIKDIETKCQQPAEALLKNVKSTLSRCENVKFGKSQGNKNEICRKKGVSPKMKMPMFHAAITEATNSKFKELTLGAADSELTNSKFQVPTFSALNSEATNSKFQVPIFSALNSEATKSKCQVSSFSALNSEATNSKCQVPSFSALNSEATNSKCQVPSFSALNSEATNSKCQVPSFSALNSEATNSKCQVPSFSALNSEATKSKCQVPSFSALNSEATNSKCQVPSFSALNSEATKSKCQVPTFGAANSEATNNKFQVPIFWTTNAEAMKDKHKMPACVAINEILPDTSSEAQVSKLDVDSKTCLLNLLSELEKNYSLLKASN